MRRVRYPMDREPIRHFRRPEGTAMKVLMCGSREWADADVIQNVIAGLDLGGPPTFDHIIHGAARGADSIVGQVARKLGLLVNEFPADWRGHGKAAGAIRNKLMLEQKPDVVFAFKDDFDFTYQRGGTENMVRIAKEAGIPTYVVSHG